MKFFLAVFFACLCHFSFSYLFDRKILWSQFQANNQTRNLLDVTKYRDVVYKDVKKLLLSVPEDVKRTLIAKADELQSQEWKSIQVREFLQYVKNGNRKNFETSNSVRRNKLSILVVAELLTNKGKYMDAIADGLWLTLEESTWLLPAHVYLQKAGLGLPDPKEPVVDLRVGETSNFVSWIRFLLYDRLAKYAPKNMMIKRIDFELNKRVIQPFLTHDNWFWIGFNSTRVNNWNIWINTNILKTAILAVDDQNTRNRVIAKTIRSADKFLDSYPNDGGCDEGPNYWTQAGGRLIELVDLLTAVSNNKMSWADNKLIKKIGDYIYKIHIDKDKFVNFADASARLVPEPVRVLRFGQVFNDDRMNQFAAYLSKLQEKNKTNWMLEFFNDEVEHMELVHSSNSLDVFINELQMRKIMKSYQPKAPQVKVAWLNDTQALMLRSKDGSADGLFFAAKGGHNAESHNHNDVGSFILYLNGQPALIDVGVGTYSRQTFSKDRYKLWYMQSQWHNLPTINGIMQSPGGQYKARNVLFNSNQPVDTFSMDIAAAYHANASVLSWKRTFTFDGSARQLNLTEEYELSALKKPFVLHFITALSKVDNKKGRLRLSGKNQTLIVDYDSKLFNVTAEKKPVIDDRIAKVWGKTVVRVNMTSTETESLKGQFAILFKMA